jgi:predicted nuclease with TOPRIM domain
MDEVIKISEAELAEIKMLQGKFFEKHSEFGDLYVEKLELDKAVSAFVEKEKTLKENWDNLQKLEQDLMDKIVKKYGEGHLNMGDGTFTPTVIATK